MKELWKKLKDFANQHKVTALLGGIVLLLILGTCLCSCDPGVIHADITDNITITDAVYIGVSGVYKIDKGTQEVITEDGVEKTELAGYVFPISQNAWVVTSLDCHGYSRTGGYVDCSGSENFHFDPWYGPYETKTSGKMVFNEEDETVEVKIQINGSYLEVEFNYTINYDLIATRQHFDGGGGS